MMFPLIDDWLEAREDEAAAVLRHWWRNVRHKAAAASAAPVAVPVSARPDDLDRRLFWHLADGYVVNPTPLGKEPPIPEPAPLQVVWR